MKKIFGALIVLVALYFGVSIGMYVALPPTVRAQVNTFCAANLACTVTANWGFAGNNTHTGTETFANINTTNAGVFTGTQMNEYMQSLINSCSPSSEFQAAQGASFATDALAGCIAAPVGATTHQPNAVAGYANSSCNSLTRTVCNTVGGYFQSRALVNGAAVWGTNNVAQDQVGVTGAFITGSEYDVIVNGTPSLVIGQEISIGGAGTPGISSFGLSVTNGGSGAQWNFGINVARGSTTTAGLFIDGLNSTNNTFSAPIQLAGWDSGGTKHVVQIQADPTGILNLSPPSGTATRINNSPLQLFSTIQSINATATMGLTLKTGSGSGNYTGANTAFAAVDTTNLCYSVTIPTGWKLSVQASGVLESVTAAVVQSVALADAGATCTTGGVTALAGSERDTTPTAIATFDAPFATGYVLTGDGNAHSILLLAKTANGSDDWGIQNTSAAAAPSMTFTLMPSN